MELNTGRLPLSLSLDVYAKSGEMVKVFCLGVQDRLTHKWTLCRDSINFIELVSS